MRDSDGHQKGRAVDTKELIEWSDKYLMTTAKRYPLALVRGAYNAILVVGDAVGDTLYYGKGAGQMPTASAVVADLIDVAIGRAQKTFATLKLGSSQTRMVRVQPSANVLSRFYLRVLVEDRPGVLAEVTDLETAAQGTTRHRRVQTFAIGSDIHGKVTSMIQTLVKLVPPGGNPPGIQQTQLRGLMQNAGQNAMLQNVMKSLGAGGAQPGGGASPPPTPSPGGM